MKAGKLDKRITFQKKTKTLDEWGGDIFTWSDIGLPVWARKRPLRGRELVAAQAAQSEATDMYYCRYKSDLTSADRISFNGKYYDIQSIIDIDEKNVELEITTKTGLSEG